MTYVPAIRTNPTNEVTPTGYQVAGSAGRDLLETGSAELEGRRMPVSARVGAYHFSAHVDGEGLRAFLADCRDATVLADHGDTPEGLARSLRAVGVDASAP